MGRKKKVSREYGEGEGAEAETKETKEAPVTMGEVTEENPSGIEAVSDERAEQLGQLRGFGGPGADGATVAGPEVHVATEGGEKPLPLPVAQQIEPEGEGEGEEEAEARTGTDD